MNAANRLPIDGDGGGPHDPDMETRVARLEEDMREVKGILGRLEPMIVRIDERLSATLPHISTKAESASVEVKLADADKRLTEQISARPTTMTIVAIVGLAAALAALPVWAIWLQSFGGAAAQ